MTVAGAVDEMLRDLAAPAVGRVPAGTGPRAWSARRSRASSARVEPRSRRPQADAAEREALVESLAKTYGDRLAVQVLPDDVSRAGRRRREAARRRWACSAIAPTCSRRPPPSWSGPPRRPATCSASPSRPCSPGSPIT